MPEERAPLRYEAEFYSRKYIYSATGSAKAFRSLGFCFASTWETFLRKESNLSGGVIGSHATLSTTATPHKNATPDSASARSQGILEIECVK